MPPRRIMGFLHRYMQILQYFAVSVAKHSLRHKRTVRQTDGVGPVPVGPTTECRDHLQDIQDAAGRETGKDL